MQYFGSMNIKRYCSFRAWRSPSRGRWGGAGFRRRTFGERPETSLVVAAPPSRQTLTSAAAAHITGVRRRCWGKARNGSRAAGPGSSLVQILEKCGDSASEEVCRGSLLVPAPTLGARTAGHHNPARQYQGSSLASSKGPRCPTPSCALVPLKPTPGTHHIRYQSQQWPWNQRSPHQPYSAFSRKLSSTPLRPFTKSRPIY